jgi:hypothetical protein
MAFRRTSALMGQPSADVLTHDMVGSGMNFAARPAQDPNIEDTLLFASADAIEKPDLRTLAVLVTWFGVHSCWLSVDRLTHLVSEQSSERVRALWSSLARWQEKDSRFVCLSKLYTGPHQDLLHLGTEFQIKRHGVDPRFRGGVLRVAANVLRDRVADVLSPADLAKRHRAYHFRIMIGPSYRADMGRLYNVIRSCQQQSSPGRLMVHSQRLGASSVSSQFWLLKPYDLRPSKNQEAHRSDRVVVCCSEFNSNLAYPTRSTSIRRIN